MDWNWKKKLLLDALVFLLAGAACAVVFDRLDSWSWGLSVGMILWPVFPIGGFGVFMTFGGVWMCPLLWLSVAGVLIWLFARQFRRTDGCSVWLAAASVAGWWFSGLFWMWALSGWE